MHRAVSFFEDAPCYKKEEILKLHSVYRCLADASNEEKAAELCDEMAALMDSIQPLENCPEKIYLWSEGNMPSTGEYKENPEYRYNHDPEFMPYMYAMKVAEGVNPKGAVVVCAGGDHGDCTLHEGYQTCLDLNDLGYQCFLLLNRTNLCPYQSKEAGADAARAIQYVRKNAAAYGVDENKVAFAGFSNGGLTAEACIQYYSGTQRMKTHFPDYVEESFDAYYGAPDAVVCVYGPRWKGEKFDYTNVVYPPTFFAVGREDSAMENLHYVYPELIAHHVEVEVHTFSGVPHGQSGISVYGENRYPHFQLWLPLADAFMQNVFAKSVVKRTPDRLEDREYRYDAFESGKPLLNKKKNHLPAMGWNSWNAFGSGNTEKLTKDMADAMVELGLDRLGYEFVVLDDGCYKPTRVDGRLSNETNKFPGGFRALSDYIHGKGLKFGMYNDIGTNLCAGAAVGTCGHELTDAQSYVDWGVDFLKVDNCYYLFDNATFSDAANAKYVYAPEIRGIAISGISVNGFINEFDAVKDGILVGQGASKTEDCVTGIGTFDGTGPEHTPVGARSGELTFVVNAPEAGTYELTVTYRTGVQVGRGSWLQVAVGRGEEAELYYDDFLPSTGEGDDFAVSPKISLELKKGRNELRLMNHRRQENTLSSYAALLEGLNQADPDHDIIFSICEWGKTQPHNWGYKVGDSWRILNDITFRVGADGDPGHGSWIEDYTTSVTSQYNKAVIMDEFAGLDKGWNDPDMLMIGMDGLNDTMNRTHMAMWCMMNSPLMLGLDLRRVKKGDAIWQIIANEKLIALNQDPLGIPAKRIYCSLEEEAPDTEYITNRDRVDILAKPLADGSVALSFINVSEEDKTGVFGVDKALILKYLEKKLADADRFAKAVSYRVTDLWTGAESENSSGRFEVDGLKACENVTVRVTPV